MQYKYCIGAGGVKYTYAPMYIYVFACSLHMYSVCTYDRSYWATQVCSVSSTVNKTILYTNSNGKLAYSAEQFN